MQAYLGQFISSGTSILECKLPTSKVGSELIQPASLPKKRPPTWVLCQLRNNLVIPQIPHLEEGAEWSKHEAKPGWSILETCQGKAPLWSESHESGTIFGLLGVALAGLRIFKKVPENVTPGCLSSVLYAHMSHLFTQNIQLACEAVTPHHEMVATQLDGLVAGKSKEVFIVKWPAHLHNCPTIVHNNAGIVFVSPPAGLPDRLEADRSRGTNNVTCFDTVPIRSLPQTRGLQKPTRQCER